MFPVGPDPPADPLGACVARGTAGRHGAVSHRLLGDRAGSRQVTEQLIAALITDSICDMLALDQTQLSIFHNLHEVMRKEEH